MFRYTITVWHDCDGWDEVANGRSLWEAEDEAARLIASSPIVRGSLVRKETVHGQKFYKRDVWGTAFTFHIEGGASHLPYVTNLARQVRDIYGIDSVELSERVVSEFTIGESK